mgnify:CR=1 FL=1
MKYDKQAAVRFVVLLGLVSLFSDMTYEGARSINGQFLNILGTSGSVVGWVAGLGELIGYGLRFISGYIADKTKKYWLISIIGYCINLLCVPLLALAGYWQIAVVLMIGERIGKALRTPSRDALLSFGTKQLGTGWGYGLHEAMDQIGATLGPILVGAILALRNFHYQDAYFMLLFPAIIAISILIFTFRIYPKPENLEIKTKSIEFKGYSKVFWWYVLAVIFIAAGYVDFPIIAYHIKFKEIMSDTFIPMIYALAMISDAIAALILGKLFDKIGLKSLIIAIALSFLFAPMVFLGNVTWIVIGMILWGIGMGAQESILRAVIANIVPQNKRGTAFGTFNALFGISWFIGSAFIGYMYDFSLTILIIFSVATQILGFIFILISEQKLKVEQTKIN